MGIQAEMQKFVDELVRETVVVADTSTRTGVVSLDVALGGWLPAGAVEIYGPESVGKTSLLYDIMATAQHDGFEVALCASEYLDLPYMKKLRVNLDALPIIVGSSGEAALRGAQEFLIHNLGTSTRCLVAIDSATGFRPEEDQFGNWLNMIHDFLESSLAHLPARSSIVMVNQVRVKRSLNPQICFAGGTDSTARKLAEMFDARLELSRREVTDDDYTLEINVVRNRDRPPHGILEVPVVKGVGIDSMRDLVRVAVAMGLIEQVGSWYRCMVDGFQTSLGQGEATAARMLSEHPDIARLLVGRVMSNCR